jgi:glycosyltransferase involved in cell wall biosynthesis
MQEANGLRAVEALEQLRDSPAVRLTPEAFAKRSGGVRRTALELLEALREVGAPVSVSAFIERTTTQTSPTPSPLRRVLLQAAETGYFARKRLHHERGVAHSLYYDQQLRPADWPLVVTVHDVIHERFGAGSAALRWAKRLAVHRAALVVTPSRATASDVTALFPDVGPKVITIPWGISPEFLEGVPEGRRVKSEQPFLLYVGARSGYKNLTVLVRALESASDLAEFRLVLVGGGPLLEAERTFVVEALGKPERLSHVASASDAALRRLYDEAAALVVTSRCEGFGLPILEAMARGCSVACARGGSLEEVSGGFAAMFDPDSVAECAAAVREAVAAPGDLREAARVNARGYDWMRAARAHVDVYAEIAR